MNNIHSSVRVDFEKEGNPGEILSKSADVVGAAVNLTTEAGIVLGLTGNCKTILDSMENGSVIVNLKTNISDRYSNQMNAIEYFIKNYIGSIFTIFQSSELITMKSIEDAQRTISDAADRTQLNDLMAYRIPTKSRIANDVLMLQDSMERFSSSESCTLQIANEIIRYPNRQIATKDIIQDLLVDSVISTENRRILVIKRPDLLGNSMWEFKLDKRIIKVSIMDLEWIIKFHDEKRKVSYGMGLDVMLLTRSQLDATGEIIDVKYFIKKVYDIIDITKDNSQLIDFDDE